MDLATGYVVGKIRGQTDVEILDTMLTQGLLGAGFKVGKKFADLTVQEKQLAWQRFKTVAGEVNKAVNAQYQIARFKLLNKAFVKCSQILNSKLLREILLKRPGANKCI